MNVKQLKQLLEKVPNDVVVLVPTRDHSYTPAYAKIDTALFEEGIWSEDHGDQHSSGPESVQRRTVLVVEP